MSTRDILLALTCILIWGGNIVAIKMGVMALPAPILLTLRFALTALAFLPFIKWPGRKTFWLLVETSLYMSVIHQGLLFMAIRVLDASTMAILLQSQILFATLLGWLILKEKIAKKTAVGLTMGFTGLLLTLGGPDLTAHPSGFFLTLASTVFLSLSYIRMRQMKNVHPTTFIAVINMVAVPFVFLLSLIVAPEGWLHLGEADWVTLGGVLLYQVLFVSLSHILWQSLMTRNPVATVASFVLLMPIVAIMLSAIVLHETMHSSLIWGGIMTLVGVGIITLRKTKRVLQETDPVI